MTKEQFDAADKSELAYTLEETEFAADEEPWMPDGAVKYTVTFRLGEESVMGWTVLFFDVK